MESYKVVIENNKVSFVKHENGKINIFTIIDAYKLGVEEWRLIFGEYKNIGKEENSIKISSYLISMILNQRDTEYFGCIKLPEITEYL